MTPIEEQIQNLLLATTKMEKTQEITTENVNKLVINMEKLIPIHEEIKNLGEKISNLEDESKLGFTPTVTKWLIGLMIMYSITFGTWVVVTIFSLDKIISSHIARSDEIVMKFKEDISDNKNQITYLKGRLKTND